MQLPVCRWIFSLSKLFYKGRDAQNKKIIGAEAQLRYTHTPQCWKLPKKMGMIQKQQEHSGPANKQVKAESLKKPKQEIIEIKQEDEVSEEQKIGETK